MDTSEFFNVTKNKVGYRLREILSGKSKVMREKDTDGNWGSVKVYVFNHEKLRRVSRKYGYELVTKLPLEKSDSNILVTKLPTLPSSKSVKTYNSTLKHHENNVEKRADTSQQLGKLSNSVTKLGIQTVLTVKALDPVTRGNCPIARAHCKSKAVTHSLSHTTTLESYNGVP